MTDYDPDKHLFESHSMLCQFCGASYFGVVRKEIPFKCEEAARIHGERADKESK